MELGRRWLRRGEGTVRAPGKAAVEESSVGVKAAEFVTVMIPRRLIVDKRIIFSIPLKSSHLFRGNLLNYFTNFTYFEI